MALLHSTRSGARLGVVSDVAAPEPPYPRETHAKGWCVELDMQRVRKSDTWVLAPRELRPWLLLLWVTAWEQRPCGSLPADDELIAAHMDMDARQFRAHRDILLRGWVLHSDGRLYHPIVTQQVLALIAIRRKEATRKKGQRIKNQQLTSDVPRDSRGTPVGLPRDCTLRKQESRKINNLRAMSRGTPVGLPRDSTRRREDTYPNPH